MSAGQDEVPTLPGLASDYGTVEASQVRGFGFLCKRYQVLAIEVIAHSCGATITADHHTCKVNA